MEKNKKTKKKRLFIIQIKHLVMAKRKEFSQDLCNLIAVKHIVGINYRHILKLLNLTDNKCNTMQCE